RKRDVSLGSFHEIIHWDSERNRHRDERDLRLEVSKFSTFDIVIVAPKPETINAQADRRRRINPRRAARPHRTRDWAAEHYEFLFWFCDSMRPRYLVGYVEDAEDRKFVAIREPGELI